MKFSRSWLTNISAAVAATTAITLAPTVDAITKVGPAPVDDPYAYSTAHINYRNEDGKYTGCSGVVVDPLWIMTTVHCFAEDDRFVDTNPARTIQNGDKVNEVDDSVALPSINNTELPEVNGSSASDLTSLLPGTPNISEPDPTPEENKPEKFTYPVNEIVTPEAESVFIRLGRNWHASPRIRAVEIIQHPEGYDAVDLALIKLDLPVDATPIPLADEPITNETPSRVYGYSERTRPTDTVRVTDGLSQPTRSYEREMFTYLPNGVMTENGDSGGPIIANGELIGIHKGTSNNPYPQGYRSRGVSVSYAHDWIVDTIATR